ncbi:MAG: hypothetical protein AABZ60_20810 [Planctomycetota bacterium]
MVESIKGMIRKGCSDLEISKAVAGSEKLREEYKLLYPNADWGHISQIFYQRTQIPTREYLEGILKLIEGPHLFWRVVEDDNSFLVEVTEPLKKQRNLIRFNKLKSVSKFYFETCYFGKN